MSRKLEIAKMAGIGLIATAMWTVFTTLSDASPAEAYAIFSKGIFGDLNGFMEVSVRAIFLIFIGLGCAMAFGIGFFSIGTEGQFYIGALAFAWAALTWTGVPGGLRILCAILMGFVFGGLQMLMAAMFKAEPRMSEITVTIMLNYIAINLLGIAIRALLVDPARNISQPSKPGPSVTPYQFLKLTRLHAGFIITMFMAFLVWLILEKTTVGYEVRMVGFSRRTITCNGISVVRNIIISAFLGGGLVRIAGVVEVMSVQRKLLEGISGECGYTAMLIALLVSNHLVGILFVAIGLATLKVGANSMWRRVGVSPAIVNTPVGLIVLLILDRELFSRKRKGEEPC